MESNRDSCWNCQFRTDAHDHRQVVSVKHDWCVKKDKLINKAGRPCLAYQRKEG